MTNTELPAEDMLAAIDLKGMHVGLSGAIPDTDDWAEGRAMDWEILNAVSTLADTVFRGGGILVHGSHPSFTPRIIAQAEPYAAELGKPVAVFFLSGLFAKDRLTQQLLEAEKRGVLELRIIEPVYPGDRTDPGDPEVRNASLTAMRERMIGAMDALVIVGGKRHRNSPRRPGTEEELQLALNRKIPVFPLGGLGGMASELAERPAYEQMFSTGGTTPPPQASKGPLELKGDGVTPSKKTQEENQFITTTDDYGRAIELIAVRLSRSPRHGPGELLAY